ncbi:hypothetical protein DPV78_011670 [Talaromyces pinophilus]|nr:hypothetical protein DPV78_011670 [Talaromyces pinophilus]
MTLDYAVSFTAYCLERPPRYDGPLERLKHQGFRRGKLFNQKGRNKSNDETKQWKAAMEGNDGNTNESLYNNPN